MKAAPFRQIHRARQITFQQYAFFFAVQFREWDGRHQGFRIRMFGMCVQFFCIGYLDDFPQIHDCNPVGDVFNNRKVMGNEKIGQSESGLQILEQVDNLGLNGHIKRGNRLVADNNFWIDCKSPCDPYTLALPPGKLMRIAVEIVSAQTDNIEQFIYFLFRFLPGNNFMDCQRLVEHLADHHSGVQGAERVLEDHLYLTAQAAEITIADRFYSFAVIPYPSLDRNRSQPQERTPQGCLAAT